MATEKRLIDANACPALFDEEYKKTRQLINQGETHLDNLAEGFTEAHRVIQEMPTVNAVEVVRCKDCIRRYDTDECPMCHLSEGKYYEYTNGNGYCDRGEREENELVEREI